LKVKTGQRKPKEQLDTDNKEDTSQIELDPERECIENLGNKFGDSDFHKLF